MPAHLITFIALRVHIKLLHMKKPKKVQQFVARKLSVAEKERTLANIGKLIRAVRIERTTEKRLVSEINISRKQLIKIEEGGNMRLSTFLKLIYGLDISGGEFFSKLGQRMIPR